MTSNEKQDSTNDESIEAMYTQSLCLILSFFYFFREQKRFQSRPETYNGAERDLYSWTQTITDIDVRIKVKLLFKSNVLSNRSLRFQNI